MSAAMARAMGFPRHLAVLPFDVGPHKPDKGHDVVESPAQRALLLLRLRLRVLEGASRLRRGRSCTSRPSTANCWPLLEPACDLHASSWAPLHCVRSPRLLCVVRARQAQRWPAAPAASVAGPRRVRVFLCAVAGVALVVAGLAPRVEPAVLYGSCTQSRRRPRLIVWMSRRPDANDPSPDRNGSRLADPEPCGGER
jgi:hypothetical protein